MARTSLSRGVARLAALAIALGSLFLIAARPSGSLAADNAIVLENQIPGTSAWQIGGQVSNDTTGQIKAYASATSALQGETISLHVSVNPAQTYTIDFYRIGWYAGLGGRHRLHVGPLAGTKQNACVPAADTGLIECGWLPSYTFTIPTDWTSGVYLALLENAAGYQNYAMFVVRDGRPADILYQQSVTTYQAYNNYPDDGQTGKSLYAYNSYGASTVSGEARAVKVSFDRPYRYHGGADFREWEIQLIRWLERSGYDVTYSTNVDTHTSGAALLSHKAFFSTGHDEYWSKEMRDAVEAARDAGVDVAFMGANPAYWQIRFESSTVAGVPNRVVVGYKTAPDPIQGPTSTVRFKDPPVNRPEQSLVGLTFAAQSEWGNNAPYVVQNSSHWAYAGTGFVDGASVPGLIGYESDYFSPDFAPPVATTRALLSASPFVDIRGRQWVANSSIYQAPSGAWVFASGTMSWSWGLDDYGHNAADSRIQRTTVNILDAFLGTVTPPPPTPAPEPTPTPTPPPSPVVLSVTPSSFAGETTAHAVTMPATVEPGDLLITVFVNDGSATVTNPSGWTIIGSNANGTAVRATFHLRRASGGEDGTTVNFQTSVAEKAAAQVYRIQAGTWRDSGTLSQDVEKSALSGTSAFPDPYPVNPANWDIENTLWIAYYVADDDDDASAYPAGYTNGSYAESDASDTSASLGSAYRSLAVASDNPAPFTIAAAQEWVAGTIAVRPSASAAAPTPTPVPTPTPASTPTPTPPPPAAFPVVLSVTSSSFASDATSHNVTMPGTVDPGDLLIGIFTNDGTAGVATPVGWTTIGTNARGTAVRVSIYVRRATGTEAGATVNFQTSANEKAVAQVFRIQAGTWRDSGTLANDVVKSAVARTNASPDPYALNPAPWDVESTLWIAYYGADDDDDLTAYPLGYSGGAYTESDASSTGVSMGSARRTLAAASEDPGPFTIAASDEWVAGTIAVRPAAGP